MCSCFDAIFILEIVVLIAEFVSSYDKLLSSKLEINGTIGKSTSAIDVLMQLPVTLLHLKYSSLTILHNGFSHDFPFRSSVVISARVLLAFKMLLL